MSIFSRYFVKIINEEIGMTSAGAFGAGGDQGGMFPGGSDFYAPGDARVPDLIGSKPKKNKKRRKKRRKNKKRVKKEQLRLQRRNLSRSL